jgi:glyoxylase-like metal-dependent hydrolase (beta-lactamase superfamily II)/8-oxo-dGTP pyrophosphatase MutT (NUDIX family)
MVASQHRSGAISPAIDPVSSITPAASVLLSPGPGAPEVFVVRRGRHLKFFGGFWAFPGGRLDADDAVLAGADGPTVEACRFAACRELFEEAGVLVARRSDGSFLPAGDHLDRLRRELLDGRLPFSRLLAEAGLSVHADDFRHIGQLTTPPFSPIRFATTFFTAHLPPGQRAAVWDGELLEGRWAPARDFLDGWFRGEWLLTPPAVTILEGLADAPTDAAPQRLGPEFARHDGDALPELFFAPFVQAIPLRTAALPPASHTTAYLVGHGPYYLIDPGADDPTEQQRLLDRLDRRRNRNARVHVILSHHHPDHVGAAEAVVRHFRSPVWAHPLTAERVRGRIKVDHFLNDGDRLDVAPHPDGGTPVSLEVLHTPGHAPGHLAFFEPSFGLLFAGDMVSTMTSIVVSPPDGDLVAYLASLRRLRELPARLLLPSHGNVSARPQDVIDEALAHRAKREAQLLEALGDGPATIEELTPRLYRGVPESLWRFAGAQLLAGLLKLQGEGRARPAGGGRWELM